MTTKPKPPAGLKIGGQRLWDRVLGDFELAEHEQAVLLQACRTVDILDRLQVVIDDGAVVVESPQGLKTNPAIVEFRQQAVTLAKCMAALRIPAEDCEDPGRTQQRVGVRRPTLRATK
jgi:hypothetical protein